MSVIYRWTIDVDDYKTRHMIHPHGSVSGKRDGKALGIEAFAAFHKMLQQYVPNGPKARAWIEKNESRWGTTQLDMLKGTSLTKDRISGKPITGEWVSASTGEVVRTK